MPEHGSNSGSPQGADANQVPGRGQAMEGHRKQGGEIAAVFPIHYPRALLRAFGLLPVEVWGPPGRDTVLGNAHLQAYTCSIVRCGLSYIKEGKLDSVALVMVPHACDSLQGLGSMLQDFTETPFPVLTFYMPRGRRDADLEFLAGELRRLHDKLAAITAKDPGEAELLRCVKREESADQALGALLRARPGLGLSNESFYQVARSREYLPAEDFEPLARAAVEMGGDAPQEVVRVVLSGLVPEPRSVLKVLDQAGVMVAADDLACCGRRLYGAGSSDDPFVRMAQGFMAGPPDTTRGCTIGEHLEHLLALARGADAFAVVHFDIKFCEPEQFYIPQVDQGLNAAGLRTLSVEVDIADPLPDQVITRLEAFAETLS